MKGRLGFSSCEGKVFVRYGVRESSCNPLIFSCMSAWLVGKWVLWYVCYVAMIVIYTGIHICYERLL